MTSRSSRTRRPVNLFAIAGVGAAIAAGIVGFACGFDGEGTKEPPVIPGDTSPPIEASVIPLTDAQGGVDAGVDAPPPSPTCPAAPAAHGPAMVRFPDGGFCIDTTEVTNQQYDDFLAATGGGAVDAGIPDGGLPSRCKGIKTFSRGTAEPPDAGTKPVTTIPWCAAAAYCAWAGKRLCGGGVAGSPTTGEWYAACSDNGTRSVAYGPAFVHGTCNEDGVDVGLEAVASRPACEGGVPGLADMSGNAAEWVDSCDGPGDASSCVAQGTYYGSGPTGTCASFFSYATGLTDNGFGFRCCADAP